jgi:hypothetical protein
LEPTADLESIELSLIDQQSQHLFSIHTITTLSNKRKTPGSLCAKIVCLGINI